LVFTELGSFFGSADRVTAIVGQAGEDLVTTRALVDAAQQFAKALAGDSTLGLREMLAGIVGPHHDPARFNRSSRFKRGSPRMALEPRKDSRPRLQMGRRLCLLALPHNSDRIGAGAFAKSFFGCLASGRHSLGVRAHASGWPEKEITALRVVLDHAITRGLLVDAGLLTSSVYRLSHEDGGIFCRRSRTLASLF
jgi:hypothetical protein